MKKLFPFLFIFLVVAVFFRPFLFNGFLPIPSDTIIGLYNPFRDLYAKDFPRGIPFKNFLITDPVRQQYPWRFESILQERMGQLPLWNPYNFAGTPLLANQQSAVLNPFNVLFFLMPFPYAWSLLILFQPLLGGVFLYLYLRNQKISRIPCLLGSTAFVFSGFFTSWLEWGTIDMVAIWLPLILLSIDKIFLEKKYRWYFIYFTSHIIAFFAGHLQTFVYLVVLAHVYMLMRIFQSKNAVKTLLIGIPFGVFTLLITAIQWVPMLQFIFLSGRNADLIIQEGWFIPWQHLVTFLVPDFFGNPTTLNYWGVWNYAELAGYVGIPALFFAVDTLFWKMRNVEWFFWITIIIALLFALPTPLGYLPLTLHIPFLSTAQPTRLLFVIDFSLCILATYGMEKFLEQKSKKIILPILLFLILFAGMWVIVLFPTRFLPMVSLENFFIAKHNLIFPTIVLGVLIALCVAEFILKKTKLFFVLSVGLLLLNGADTIRFAEKFIPFTPHQYLFPATAITQFLQKNIGNYRIMETSTQILPPNFSLMYHIESVDGYDPLYINTYGQLIAAVQRNKPDIHTPFGFNRLITPENYQSPVINLLGVKYILSLNKLYSPTLTKVFSEGQTIVYENKNVFPRAFFAASVSNANNQQEAVNFLFNTSHNLRDSAIASHVSPKDNLSQGKISLSQYTANSIILQTENISDGFLVLTDAYYPTWHAYIDGKETKIYVTDLTLRGIFVPKGRHVVRFGIQLW